MWKRDQVEVWGANAERRLLARSPLRWTAGEPRKSDPAEAHEMPERLARN